MAFRSHLENQTAQTNSHTVALPSPLNYDLSLSSYRLFLLLWEQTTKQQENEEENYSRNTCWCVLLPRGKPNG